MARARIASKEVDLEKGTVTLKFAHGADLVIQAASLPKEMQKRAMLHGLSQKVGDSYSGADKPEDAFDIATKSLETINSGDWNVGRGAGEGTPRVGALAKGVARAMGKTLEEATAAVEALDDEQKKAVRAHPDVKAAMAAIRAEEAAAAAAKGKGEDAADLSSLL